MHVYLPLFLKCDLTAISLPSVRRMHCTYIYIFYTCWQNKIETIFVNCHWQFARRLLPGAQWISTKLAM